MFYASAAVPGQDVGCRYLQRSCGHACCPGTCRAALLRRPVRLYQREQRKRLIRRYRHDLDLGARHTRAGLDEPAKRDRLGRADRVERARAVQSARGYYNSQMPSRMIRKQCELDDAGERTLEMAVRRMGLSARAHDRILKVSRTIADLEAAPSIEPNHLSEAIQYRTLDRTYWA